MNELYCDGGLIGPKNPSVQGGTWAWRRVDDIPHNCHTTGSGILLPAEIDKVTVSNNNTELKALCEGLLALPEGWVGTVYSDSALALGWVFGTFKRDSIPSALNHLLTQARSRVYDSGGRTPCVLLGGHPTKNDLAVGYRESQKPHLPVSIHNVWTDQECRRLSRIHRDIK